MEVVIGDDEGIKVRFNGECIAVEDFGGGWLSPTEARLAADVFRLMADHLEAMDNGH